MALEIDKVGIEDLVRELSGDALRYFAELELSDEWPPHTQTLSGKFVRLGRVILLGPAIQYGPTSYSGPRRSLMHIGMLGHGMRRMGDELTERIRQSAPEDGAYLDDRWPLVDAGRSRIQVDGDGQPIGLVLNDRSGDFGRPNETIRLETGEIAQSILGPQIHVSAD